MTNFIEMTEIIFHIKDTKLKDLLALLTKIIFLHIVFHYFRTNFDQPDVSINNDKVYKQYIFH